MGWRNGTPEEQGIDSARLADALLTIREKGIKVHSLMLIRNGYVVLEAYIYPYDGRYVHDLASVTKTVTATLSGIAADQGRLQVDQPVVSFFSDRSIANYDDGKQRITVGQLASMSSGLECTSERDEATLKEMLASADWLQFVLDRPVHWEPGTQFVYCSPGSYLLSAVLQGATGVTALEFARANLFEPLGIRDVIWPAEPQGITHGWGRSARLRELPELPGWRRSQPRREPSQARRTCLSPTHSESRPCASSSMIPPKP